MKTQVFLSISVLLVMFCYSCGGGGHSTDYTVPEEVAILSEEESEMAAMDDWEMVMDDWEMAEDLPPKVQSEPKEVVMNEPEVPLTPLELPDEAEPIIQEDRLKSKDYKAVLAADSVIDGERKGTMTVYIGELDAVDARIKEIKNKPASEKSVIGTTSIANTGEYVRITPDSSHFHVHPKVSECLPIRPIASQKFSLTPKERSGVFAVSAQI
ncbi:MAG: hypothetical protein FWF09_03765, partial [Bacteroidales bacterium]|nr:hypothetical protein [Bacteroidales bacterium]